MAEDPSRAASHKEAPILDSSLIVAKPEEREQKTKLQGHISVPISVGKYLALFVCEIINLFLIVSGEYCTNNRCSRGARQGSPCSYLYSIEKRYAKWYQ